MKKHIFKMSYEKKIIEIFFFKRPLTLSKPLKLVFMFILSTCFLPSPILILSYFLKRNNISLIAIKLNHISKKLCLAKYIFYTECNFAERKGLLLYEPIKIEYFIMQWLKPVLRYWNLQKTSNYDAIQVINPPIF